MRNYVSVVLCLAVPAVCQAQQTEIKRANVHVSQTYGIYAYEVDQSIASVLTVKLQNLRRQAVGTYTLDERGIPAERIENLQIAWAESRRRTFSAIARSSSETLAVIWRDNSGEATLTFTLATRSWAIEGPAEELGKRNERNIKFIEALLDDLRVEYKKLNLEAPKLPTADSSSSGLYERGRPSTRQPLLLHRLLGSRGV
jgi:hypothetical protein